MLFVPARMLNAFVPSTGARYSGNNEVQTPAHTRAPLPARRCRCAWGRAERSPAFHTPAGARRRKKHYTRRRPRGQAGRSERLGAAHASPTLRIPPPRVHAQNGTVICPVTWDGHCMHSDVSNNCECTTVSLLPPPPPSPLLPLPSPPPSSPLSRSHARALSLFPRQCRARSVNGGASSSAAWQNPRVRCAGARVTEAGLQTGQTWRGAHRLGGVADLEGRD